VVAEIILLKACITMTNKKEDRGSPCPNPQELPKKLEEEPLIKMEKHTDEIQWAIQEHHFSPNPHLLSK
jgi:hypothetical protein